MTVDKDLLPSPHERKAILEMMVSNLKQQGYTQAMEALQKRAQLAVAAPENRNRIEAAIREHEEASARAYAGARALLEELARVEAELAAEHKE